MNFNRILGGLAAVVLYSNMPAIHAQEQNHSAPHVQADYLGQKSEAKQKYLISIIEREGIFEISSSGIPSPVGENDWTKISKPEDITLSGSPEFVRQQYVSLRKKSGDLASLDIILKDLTDNMKKDPSYLANASHLNLYSLSPDRQGRSMLAVNGIIDGYRIIITSHGHYTGDRLQIDDLEYCTVASKGDLKLRRIGKELDRSQWYIPIDGNQVIRHKAELQGTRLYEIGINRFSEMRQAIIDQNIRRSDLTQVPDSR